MKEFLHSAGFPTPGWTAGEGWTGDPAAEGSPVVVKSRSGTQSRGTRLSRAGVPLSADEFAEPYWQGCEYSTLVYRGEGRVAVFPPIWKGMNSTSLLPPWKRLRLCPDPHISEVLEKELAQVGMEIAESSNASGFIEVEYLVLGDGSVQVLEINPRICGTMRIAAMATGLRIFDFCRRPDLKGILPAAFWAAEVPYNGDEFAMPDIGAFATSRLTVASERFSDLRGKLSGFGIEEEVLVPHLD
ncbi:hypothetical protein HFP72_29480 [Nocardiopsis sp. ARC36]